jgi:hypothetical protein
MTVRQNWDEPERHQPLHPLPPSARREASLGRDTTVPVVRDPREAKVLRRLCGAALVGANAATAQRDRAAALGTILFRAHAWHLGPVHASAAPLGAAA